MVVWSSDILCLLYTGNLNVRILHLSWNPRFVMHAVLPIKKDYIREFTEIRHTTILHVENQDLNRMAYK